MKTRRPFLLALAGLLWAAAGFGQGQINFCNTGNTTYRLWTNNAAGTASNLMSAANGYRIGLYAAQGAGQPSNALTLVGVTVNLSVNTNFAGYFCPGLLGFLGSPGDTITFQIRAWTLSAGVSYEEAVTMALSDPLNVALGVSPIGQTTLTASPASPAPLFGTAAGLINRGWEIRPIPEPSSFALGLLAVVALALCFRRTKVKEPKA